MMNLTMMETNIDDPLLSSLSVTNQAHEANDFPPSLVGFCLPGAALHFS
jgi:hypothetical protein